MRESDSRFYKLVMALYERMGGSVGQGGGDVANLPLVARGVMFGLGVASGAVLIFCKATTPEPHGRQFAHKYIRREPDGRGGWRYIYGTTTALDPAPHPGHARFEKTAHEMSDYHGRIAAHHAAQAAGHEEWISRHGLHTRGAGAGVEGHIAAARAHHHAQLEWRAAAHDPRPDVVDDAHKAMSSAKRASDRAHALHEEERAKYGRPALFARLAA